MENVLLVIHIIACLALIAVVLLQRSEGGALGIGGGAGGGGLISGRGAANALTRATMGLAAVFFATSLTLSTIATRANDDASGLEDAAAAASELADDALSQDLLSNDLSESLGPSLEEAPVASTENADDIPSDLEEPR